MLRCLSHETGNQLVKDREQILDQLSLFPPKSPFERTVWKATLVIVCIIIPL